MSDQSPDTAAYCYFGSYERAVDPKGRFNVPFKLLRAASTEGFVVTLGPDGSLNLMPHDEFVAAFVRMTKDGEPGRQMRAEVRKLSEVSQTLVPDSQGRVAVPAELLKAAGVTSKVKIIGMGNYMELWDPRTYEIIGRALGGSPSAQLDHFFGGSPTEGR